jgi:NACHT domain
MVVEKYPLPIARTFESKLQQPQTPLHRLYGLIDVFEVSLKYCAIVAIQEYVRLGVRAPAVDEEVARHFRIPKLGNWSAFLREVLRSFRGLRPELFMPALVDFYYDARGKALDRRQERVSQLVALRNRFAHGARPSDEDSDDEFRKYWPTLASLLADLSFLSAYDLILHDEDGSAHRLMGTEPKAMALPSAAAGVGPGQLCLVQNERVLPLSPLLLYARCDYRTHHGLCSVSKIFFFNSLKHRADFLDYWMSHHRLAGDVTDRLRAIIEHSAEHIELAAPEGANAASWELLQERSEDVVGRVSEELQLLDFIAQRTRGFLIVEGDPGIGKTAQLSRTVHDLLGPKSAFGRSDDLGELATRLHENKLQVAFHLCGTDKNSQELSSILSSLINQLPARGAATTVVASDLANAARATVENTRGKVLLVIDGVDEALAGRSDAERQNVLNTLLFAGERLPTNVFVLLGSRRGAIPAIRDPEVPKLNLELSGLNDHEIRRLLFRVVSKYELEDRHVQAIARVSAGNPLYIRMLAEDFSQGRLYLEDVDQLPLGIEGYFEKLLVRFSASPQWPVLRDTLLLLSVAHGFLSIAQISAIAGLPQADVETGVDFELGALLSVAENSKRVATFQLFHAKFREFLVALFADKIPATAKRLNEGRPSDPAVSPEHLKRMGRRVLEFCGQWASVQDSYPLRYYSGHLYEAGESEQLEQLLTKTNFLDEKTRRLDDPFLAADDVSYLVRVFLQNNRDTDVAALATREEAFYRDGLAAGLRAAAGVPQARIVAIVDQLMESSKLGFFAALCGRELPLPAMNARRVAIEVAYHFGLGAKLERAALDNSRSVRILAGPYLYRFWKRDREPGWKLVDGLGRDMVSPLGLPNFHKVESCTLMSVMIMAHHYDDPATIERLRQPWSENVARLERLARVLRVLLPPALFVIQYALRHVLAAQADFQPLNLDELLAMFTNPRQIPSRKLGVDCLKELDNVDGGCERTIAALLDRQTAFDVFLMQVAERVLFVHGCGDPERIIDALWRIYREGCPWFHQSTLYTTFHILRNVPDAQDSWLETYRTMTRDTVSSTRGLFVTPNNKSYPLLPHMGWAEIIFDQHRPSGKAQFIPHFYREALAEGDLEYARRAIRAAGVLSHSYDRHDLALLALQDAAAKVRPELRETLVDLLANIRFFDEAGVNHFLGQYADADLATRVVSATPSIRAADTFNWIDNFVNAQLISSDEFRAEIVSGYRRAGTAKSLSQAMNAVLAFVLNMIAGREALQIGGKA